MYPGVQAGIRPNQPAMIMAQSGETITYAELERRSNRLAHFLRANGLGRLDRYAIFIENNPRYVECCSAGERAGLYYTCINSYLTPDEEWARVWPEDIIVRDGIVHFWISEDEPGENRQALRVAAEAITGVRGVEEHVVPAPLVPAF